MSTQSPSSSSQGTSPGPYRHVILVLSLLAVAVITLLLVRTLFVPKSFGQYGHYRGLSIGERQNLTPIHQSEESCADCHKKNYNLHLNSVHMNIRCVNCHKPGRRHNIFHKKNKHLSKTALKAKIKQLSKKDKKAINMHRNYDRYICLNCHQKLRARPTFFPQINKKQHFALTHVIKKDTKCTACHNPHTPMFLEQERKTGQLHPLITQCSSCHTEPVDTSVKLSKRHPKFFTCKDCHTRVKKDFDTKAHKSMKCGTCHQSVRTTPATVVMFKHSSSNFCLMCHQKAKFKDPKKPPKIDVKEHREEQDEDDSDHKTKWKKQCVDCHLTDEIHKRVKFRPKFKPKTEKKEPEKKEPEKKAPEKKAPEKKAPEKKAPEKKETEKKAPEKKAPEKKETKKPQSKTPVPSSKKPAPVKN